jgi:hypothetical protein
MEVVESGDEGEEKEEEEAFLESSTAVLDTTAAGQGDKRTGTSVEWPASTNLRLRELSLRWRVELPWCDCGDEGAAAAAAAAGAGGDAADDDASPSFAICDSIFVRFSPSGSICAFGGGDGVGESGVIQVEGKGRVRESGKGSVLIKETFLLF